MSPHSNDSPTPVSSAPSATPDTSHKYDKYFGTLWRHRDFRVLWLSLTITHFGGQITFLALPLTAALLLNATPTQMGLLTMMSALPYTLFGLFTGVLVDRSRKLPLVIWTDIGRGMMLLLIPVAAWLSFLSMGILYLVAFMVGLGGIIGWAAYQVFMTERVGRANLVEANSRIALSDSSSQLIGPGLAGALIHAVTAPFAMLLDGIAYFISAFMLRGIKSQVSDAPKQTGQVTWASIWGDAKEGLWLIWHNPILRAISWGLALWQMLRHAYLAIVILFAARDLDYGAGRRVVCVRLWRDAFFYQLPFATPIRHARSFARARNVHHDFHGAIARPTWLDTRRTHGRMAGIARHHWCLRHWRTIFGAGHGQAFPHPGNENSTYARYLSCATTHTKCRDCC